MSFIFQLNDFQLKNKELTLQAMFNEPQNTSSEILCYNYFVAYELVFEQETKPFYPTHEYEENGVLYCATVNQKGLYWYAYCMNNPLKYTDPTGEKWTWKHWLGLSMFTGVMPAGTMETQVSAIIGNTSISGLIGLIDGGWDEGLRRAENAWDIGMGVFQVDESQGSSFEQFGQFFSRQTWQQPMTTIGYEYAIFTNNTSRANVEYFHGATVITSKHMTGTEAVSLGGYITMNPDNGNIDYSNATLMHEYGHFVQTRQMGGLGYIPGAFLSGGSATKWDIRSSKGHMDIWLEQDANARAWSYFGDRMEGDAKKQFTKKDGRYYNRNYYDNRFIRNWLYPDFLTLYLFDITWSE